MMRRLLVQVSAFALFAQGLFAQQSRVYQDAKVGQATYTGTVTSYEIAKSIEINSNGVAHKYDLNDTETVYSISPEVATGRTVIVTEVTGEEGHKTVSIGISAPKVEARAAWIYNPRALRVSGPTTPSSFKVFAR